MTQRDLHSLLAAISRAVQAEQRRQAAAAGLPAVQWQILGYLGQANRYSNTPQALADYLGLTKGTVSQSLQRLEEGGWLKRQADPDDGRVTRLALSRRGLQLLAADGDDWIEALGRVPARESGAAADALRLALGEWQRSRSGRSFGVCSSCAHFRTEGHDLRCGLTGESLSEHDATRICREHSVR
jgi:DNA-binding MarR family transcriptional regulator